MAKSTRIDALPPGVPPDGSPVPVAGDGAAPPPPFGTQKKLSEKDVAGDLPRVCSGLDRVPAGSKAKRFKCRVANYTGHAEPSYVLALDADSARACHTKSAGLDDYLKALKAQGVKPADLVEPLVLATELPD